MSLAESAKSLRRPAAEVPSITGLRLSPYGAEASLVNISPTGLLVECSVRLKVGSPTQILFEGGFSPTPVAGRIARCEVSAMGRDGGLRYQIGIEFNSPIAFEAVSAERGEPDPPPKPALVGESSPAPRVVQNRW